MRKMIDILTYTIFFTAVIAFSINLVLVFGDHESRIQDPNKNIDFFVSKVLPACDFYNEVGLKPIEADCSEWYMTHEGNKLVIDYILK